MSDENIVTTLAHETHETHDGHHTMPEHSEPFPVEAVKGFYERAFRYVPEFEYNAALLRY